MLEKILEIAGKCNENVLIEGVHGIGKSQQVKEFAEKNDLHLETLYLSHQDVGDLIGMPTIVDSVTIWTKPSWLVRMEEAAKGGKGCVLFLDELNRAQRDVRQTALQITLEKRLHEHTLPSINGIETLVVAAINPEDDKSIDYQVDELDVALKDRFLYFRMNVDVKAWLKWAREHQVIEEITTFLAEHPDRLFLSTKESVYPTPRSWSKLSQLLKHAGKLNDRELRTIINGKIGQTVGSQFFSYYKSFSKALTIRQVEEFILRYIKLPRKEIVAKIQSELLSECPKIWVSEIAERLFEKYIKAKKNRHVLIVFLDSIPLEILASLFEGVRESSKDRLAKFALFEGGEELIGKISDKIEF